MDYDLAMSGQVEKENFFDEETLALLGAINRLKPQNPKTRNLVAFKSQLWREPPFFHEQVILLTFCGLFEKEGRGKLTEQEAIDYKRVLSWIYNLKSRQFERIKPQGRNALAVCTLQQPRHIIFCQLEKLSSRNFFNNQEWKGKLLQFTSFLAQTIVDNHLFKVSTVVLKKDCHSSF